MTISTYLALGVAVAAAAGASQASAATNVSINTATYTYASWTPSGNPTSNNISRLGGLGGPCNTPDCVTNDNIGYWTATTTFNASASSKLTITDLAADDSVVMELNRTVIPAASAGIFGPGAGYFIFTPTGSAQAWNFAGNQEFKPPQNPLVVSTGFKSGSNTLELIVDNTDDGIYGQSLTGGPSSLYFSGT